MAAQLIELKSRMLLPRDPLAEAEEVLDPRADLVDRLLEHEKFKAASQMLWSRATVEQAVFTRAEIETDTNNPDPAKRSRPLLGLQVVHGLALNGSDTWSGQIYNADDGHTYQANLKVQGANAARVEGCVLKILCKGQTWKRAN